MLPPHLQILPDAPVCALVSLNLVTVAEPTFHIARFLPSIRDHPAPLLFVWHVRAQQHRPPLPCSSALRHCCAGMLASGSHCAGV